MTFPVPAWLLRAWLGGRQGPPALDAVAWGPTVFDLTVRSCSEKPRVIHLAAQPGILRWLLVLAPLLRLSVQAGKLRWRPHPAGLLLSLDTLWWRPAARRLAARAATSAAPSHRPPERSWLHQH